MMAYHVGIFVCLWVSLVMAQNPVTIKLNNSEILSATAQSGDLHHYYFSAAELGTAIASFHSIFGHGNTKRAVSGIYLTVTSCSQPSPPPNYQGDIPSLDVFLSLSDDNTLPGPTHGSVVNDTLPGRIAWEGDGETPEVWIGVVAPTLTEDWTGQWNYQIGISTEKWMHPLLMSQALILDDTDRNHALFLSQPYSQPPSNATVLMTYQIPAALRWSYCAAQLYRVSNYTVNVTETTRGLVNGRRQQLLISNLTEGLDYTAYYITTVDNIVGISRPVTIHTKTETNCRLVYNLEFCSDVAYSVPTRPDETDDSITIGKRYDTHAQELYKPFATAISQFNCDTTEYSLVRNCTDCQIDYKRWLCAVSIPRCTSSSTDVREDVTDEDIPAFDTESMQGVREVSQNASRSRWIDEVMEPGAWTELLPCVDLCYRVVQSCPPFMQFSCPQGQLATLQYGYWKTGQTVLNHTRIVYGLDRPTCNRVGLDTSLLVISGSMVLETSVALIFGCIMVLLSMTLS